MNVSCLVAEAEACPGDSVSKAGGGCECPPTAEAGEDGCPSFPPPPCMFQLRLLEADGTPGRCCPRYECVGCQTDEDKLLGSCQCALGAIIDPHLGRTCTCLDPHKSLVNGECVCDELKCRLPSMCDRKSVAVQVREGCCKRTVCTPCPPDSESTGLNSDLVEDHCVCLPCRHTECDSNETVVIKKKGTGFPGNCCDLYECRRRGGGAGAGGAGRGEGGAAPLDEESEGGVGEEGKGTAVDASALYCQVGDVRHPDGAVWVTHDQQICRCISGLSRCSSSEKTEESQNPCFVDLKWYANGENWTKEDGCTQCICRNGEQQCISHFCEVKESHIHSARENDTSAMEGVQTPPCVSSEGRTYGHMHTWTENGGCTACVCYSGIKQCRDEPSCSSSTSSMALPSPSSPSSASVECQPLANCDKSCANGGGGFQIDSKGCEVCECNVAIGRNFEGSSDRLLAKYNISMAQLIRILDEYRSRHSPLPTTASSTTTTITTTLGSSTGGEVEDGGAGLSSRMWKEVIGAPRNEDEEVQRRPLPLSNNDTKASITPPSVHPHSVTAAAPDISIAHPASGSAGAAGHGEGSRGVLGEEGGGGGGGRTHVIVACVVAAAGATAATVAFLAAFCLYRSRRKSSCTLDLTSCRYEHVDRRRRPPATTPPTLTLLNNNNNDDVVKKFSPTTNTTEHPLL
ncbi:unnamed protein product [Callosobruchus maculatus]|uniref:Antistasin-like domain-containing protein n=1 Tax=Callosobruchus maculatus TaxID=64391 RepID=A0A653C0F3_CALMS|nr:unnamed protein product [Callosobruchus maculatus]